MCLHVRPFVNQNSVKGHLILSDQSVIDVRFVNAVCDVACVSFSSELFSFHAPNRSSEVVPRSTANPWSWSGTRPSQYPISQCPLLPYPSPLLPPPLLQPPPYPSTNHSSLLGPLTRCVCVCMCMCVCVCVSACACVGLAAISSVPLISRYTVLIASLISRSSNSCTTSICMYMYETLERYVCYSILPGDNPDADEAQPDGAAPGRGWRWGGGEWGAIVETVDRPSARIHGMSPSYLLTHMVSVFNFGLYWTLSVIGLLHCYCLCKFQAAHIAVFLAITVDSDVV